MQPVAIWAAARTVRTALGPLRGRVWVTRIRRRMEADILGVAYFRLSNFGVGLIFIAWVVSRVGVEWVAVGREVAIRAAAALSLNQQLVAAGVDPAGYEWCRVWWA